MNLTLASFSKFLFGEGIILRSKKRISQLIFYCSIVVLISSCKTSSIIVEVLKPAEITVPAEIKTLAVVNRSLAPKDDQVNTVIEGLLTGEGIFVDRQASERCVFGVADALSSSPRFKVTVPNGLNLKGTGTPRFPEPLQWNDVTNICKEYNADALILLETFDSNVSRRHGTRERTKKVDDKEVKYIEHNANLDIGIEAGWRIYFPKGKRIIDQNVFTDYKYWDAKGKSKDEAKRRLPNPREAVKEAGHFAGTQYAFRISPMWVNVSRKYYIKGPDEFESAKYNVKSNDWDGAKRIWENYLNDPDPVIAGYATYNMALAYEINGDLDTALEFAKKAYSEYHNKSALEYTRKLERRINDQYKLQKQMQED